jgi:hypothetical protein
MERVLITVMTYPHPSTRYEEVVCTAGISSEGEWVRLYPVFRLNQPRYQQFRKYQWIEVSLDDCGAGNDTRKESRRPDLASIRIVGEPLSSRDSWRARRDIIDAMPHHTVNELKRLYESERTSLGIVRPTRILDIEVREADPEWKPQWKAIYQQMRLFGDPPRPLRKLPFTFHYVFECADSDKPHVAMIEDWELGVLFLKEEARLGSPEAARDSVKHKFLNELCGPDKDTRFFMGTKFPYNTWLVLGVFWPPRVKQVGLFG